MRKLNKYTLAFSKPKLDASASYPSQIIETVIIDVAEIASLRQDPMDRKHVFVTMRDGRELDAYVRREYHLPDGNAPVLDPPLIEHITPPMRPENPQLTE